VSTDVTEVDDDSPVHPGEHHDHGPSDRQYFNIFFVLVVLTALEVSTEWWNEWFGEATRPFAVALLLFLMVVKFFLVASYFMHLKWDPSLLKRTFYFGMVVAIIVYIVALSAMNFWTNSGSNQFDDPPPVPPPPFCTGSDCPS
jgi:cytochrome c oxidase subunit IV